MAEILAIASGIAGVASLTIEVFGISYSYISEVRGASNTVHRFLKELEDLKNVLVKIKQMNKETDKLEIFGDSDSCLLSTNDGNHYIELLGTIRKKLEERVADSSFRRKMKALTWPFSEEKTRDFIELLHRHLHVYKTALAVDNLAVGNLTLNEVRQSRIHQEDAQIQTVLNWLSPLNMYQRQQDILSRRHSSTGSWLLLETAFRRWVHSESSHRTLWCPGDPGTGKTVLTSIVVDHLNSTYGSDDVRIAYVYCDYKDQAMQTAPNLIACLARQLVGHPKKLPLLLGQMYKELEPQRRRPSLEELRRLLVTLCNERERTYVIVDALDECEAMQERRHFLPLLQSLPYGSTRLFVTSRPNNEDIYRVFTTAAQINIAAPESEIERFVKEKMEERKEFLERVTPELKEQIISTIAARASGMFLLAVLQIDRICVARTIKRIKSALNSMPKELDDLYRETLKRIQGQPGEDGALGMRVLGWVTHARRPLSVEELRHGLAVEYDGDEESPDEFDPDNLLSSGSLVDVCAGLVVIDPRSQIIRLVHYTTQEYFDKERQHLFEDTESDISKACLTYLSYDIANACPNDKLISQALLSHPFLGYASLYWLSHVQSCSKNHQVQSVFAKAVKYVRDSPKITFSTMVLRKLLLQPRNLLRRELMLPLEAASECGLRKLAEFLLTHGFAVSSAALNGALHCASSEGHTDVVLLLIKNAADVGSLATDSSTALQKACKGGHLQVARVLLASGANPDTSDRWMWTPLHHAARGSHSNLVALLFANGADPNAQTPLGLTAGHIAASHGDTVTVRLILKARPNTFDRTLTTREGNTLLHSAAEASHLEVLRLLLLEGLDPLAKNKYGLTAQDLVRDNQSSEARGVFSAHTEASLFREGMHNNKLDLVPRRVPQIDVDHPDFAIPEKLWEPASYGSTNESDAKSPDRTPVPSLILVKPSLPCSIAGDLEDT